MAKAREEALLWRRRGGLRMPVVLLLFVMGVTALALFQFLLHFASTRSWLPAKSAKEIETGLFVKGLVSGMGRRPLRENEDDDETEDADDADDDDSEEAHLPEDVKDDDSGPDVPDEQDQEDEDEDSGDGESERQRGKQGLHGKNRRESEEDGEEEEEEDGDDDDDKRPPAPSARLSGQKQRQQQQQQQGADDAGGRLTPQRGSPAGASGRALVPQAQLSPRVAKTFAYFKGTCSYFCKSLIRAGYKLLPGMSGPAVPEFVVISYKSLAKYQNLKSSILNQVGYGSSCIGGGKGKQLSCKEDFAQQNGCEYRTLGVQPEQWNLRFPASCHAFFEQAAQPENQDQIWIVKPGGSFHGSGIKLYNGIDKLRYKYRCNDQLGDGVIVQRYVDKPALYAGHKFDFRSYMLVASMDPYIVFYHDGFIRRSEHAYSTDASDLGDVKTHITNARSQSSKNHFFSFEELQEQLTQESGFASDFVDRVVRPHAMRTTNFIFQAARQKFKHRKARHQVFALDWMLDGDGKMHLLEANGNPQTSDYPGLTLTPILWTSMMDLVHAVQVDPDSLPDDFSVAAGYAFEGWRLVYNELEADHEGAQYNPCKFHDYTAARHPLFGFEPH